jgi:Holliday junction resolvase
MLQQEGWQSRVVDLRSWVAWIGQGVHAGLASYYHHSAKALEDLKHGVLQDGVSGFNEQYNHAITSGRIIPNTFYTVEAKAHIERCLEYAMSHDILPAGFEVERVEQSLGPDSGNCILDVVGKKNGKPTFIDWKVKWKCKLEYVDQELEKYRYDWKEARHYPWALSQVTGQRVEEYSVVMFILQPQFKVVQRTYQVNWKVVERWAKGCEGVLGNDGTIGVWDMMGEGAGDYGPEVWQSNACYDNHFPCEYLDACWTYNLDRERMKAGGLVQVQRLNKQIVADSQVNSEERGMV